MNGVQMTSAELNELLARGRAAIWSYEERLTAAVRQVLDREAGAAARRFMQKATSLTAAATTIEKTSTMVAVFPTVEQQQKLAQPDGQPGWTIHCTLAFLGDTTVEQFEAICAALRNTVGLSEHGALEGMVGGVASFAGGPDGHPSIVLPDVPGLAELRQQIVDVLLNAGVDVAANHGWTPHLTLDYTEMPSPPSEDLLGLPLTFQSVSVVRGDVMRDDIPLNGVLTAGDKLRIVNGKIVLPDWNPPVADEVIDVAKLEGSVDKAIGGEREGALRAFGAEMPTCLVDPSAQIRTDTGEYVPKELKTMTDGPATTYLDELQNPWGASLSQAQKDAFVTWKQQQGFTAINDYLRGGVESEELDVKAIVANLDSALSTAPPVTQGVQTTVYRGVKDIRAALGRDIRVGRVIEDPGFESVTTEESVAFDYTGYEPESGLIEIELPPGTRGGWLRSAGVEKRRGPGRESDYFDLDANENREMVLPRNSRFAVVGVRRDMSTPVVTLRLLPGSLTSAGRRGACDGISVKWDVTSKFYGKTLARTGEHIGSISRTTRADVMDVIDRSYAKGLSVRDTAQAIQDMLQGSSQARAEMIARTEINRLANGASFNAMQVFSDATGVGYHKTWLTAPGAPHPRHELDEGLNGQTVAMDQPFDVNGAQLLYPGDPDGDPGETINCRCTLIYAETGEEVDTDALLAAAGLISPSNPSGGDTMADANETFDDSNMPCDNCDHAMSAHEGDGGACGMDECSCKAYVAPESEASIESVTADGVLAAAQWEMVMCPEGKATEDGRVMAPGSISWRELPLSLMAMRETSEGGHVGAELCGRIDSIWKDNGERMTLVNGSGVFDSGEVGSEISRLVGDETLRGNSVDLAIREFTIGKRADYVDEEGFWIGPESPPEEADVDMLDLLFGDGEDLIFVVWDAVIGMSTVCPFPAFEEATITLVAAGDHGMRFRMEGDHLALRMRVYSDGAMRLIVDDSLTASAAGLAPEIPPAEWFDDPEFDTATALTVTDDGRIYGHAWTWDTCHTSFPSRCVTAPHSKTEYALFHLKEVEVDSGDKIACGTITLDAPHASQAASRKEAMAHYEHTGAAVADVRVGEDEHGGWVVGALRPDASAVSVRKLRGAVLSGDWRGWEGNLELIGLLAVNIPGFPVPRRAEAVVASGREGEQVVALLAAGIVTYGSVGEHDKARLLALGARAEGGLAGLAALASSVNGGDCGCES